MIRIFYYSSTPLGIELHDWLEEQDCAIIGGRMDGEPIERYPEEYDLGISFLYPHMVPSKQVNCHTWINFHPGPLPEYRGRNIAYYAIMNGEQEFGASLHYMNEYFDTGPIIEVARFPIEASYTAGDLVKISHNLLASLFKKWLPAFIIGRPPEGRQQGLGENIYYRKGPIMDWVVLTEAQDRVARAVTAAPRYYAKVMVGGRPYRLTPEDVP